LTRSGTRALDDQRAVWLQFSDAIHALLDDKQRRKPA
jgi:hypothetical protein